MGMSNLLRLDKYVTEKFPKLSRTVVKKMVQDGAILVNSKVAKVSYLVKDTDIVTVLPPKEPVEEKKVLLEKEPLKLDILYEDKSCMVVNKPPRITVYPINESDSAQSVVDFVLTKTRAKFKDPYRAGIVHRLDKDTSGVLVLAKDQASLEALMSQFKERKVHKTYLALVYGILKYPEGIIDSPIGRSLGDRKKMSLAAEKDGKNAISHYKVLKTFRIDHKNLVSLLEVKIMTGRTHQIRVHMASLGHQVIGDGAYGNKTINKLFAQRFGLKRQFLHASSIVFHSPETKKEVRVVATLPQDLQNLKTKLLQL